MKKIIFLFVFLFHFINIQAQNSGDLDTSFGYNHTGFFYMGITPNSYDYGNTIALQSDGKIVFGGTTDNGSNLNKNFVFSRLDSTGNFDYSFGYRIISVGATALSYGSDIVIQSDGKIIMGGMGDLVSSSPSNHDFAFARINSNSTIDNTFLTDLGSNNDYCYAIDVQTDGKIVATGISNGHVALSRYNTNGTLDNTFGSSGKVYTIAGSFGETPSDIKVQSDGKIVIVGRIANNSSGTVNKFLLCRYNTNGTLDNSFGTNGILITSVTNFNNGAYKLAIQSDGKIIAVGFASNGSNNDFAIVRYNTNGTLDNTFGNSGKVITDYVNSNEIIVSVGLQQDGQIVVAGTSNYNDSKNKFAVSRYNIDGSTDSTFGTSGTVFTLIGTQNVSASDLVIQPDGKIVVVGTALIEVSPGQSYYHFALARYFGCIFPNVPGTISGLSTVCKGQNSVTYAIPPIVNATSYVWTLPVGAVGTSTTNSITVDFGNSAVSGNIKVKGQNGCGDGAESVLSILVNSLPSAPTVSTPVNYCEGSTATTLNATGTNLSWYTSPTGGSGNTTAPLPVTTSVGNTTYYVSQTVNTCESNRASITVNIYSIPSSPTVAASATYCQNTTANVLTATGSNLLWYTAASGGTGNPTAPTPLTTNAGTISFFVSQSVNNCESSRSQVDVVVNATPANPIVTNPVEYCQNETANQLLATGTNLLWYTSASGGTGNISAPTPTTTSVGTFNYYVTQSENNCESNRELISVVVKSLPNAPTVTSPVNYCQGSTASSLTVTGSNLLWYISASGGTGDANTPTPVTTFVGNTSYYVSQTINSCEGSRASITVNVYAIPSAPTVIASIDYCQNTTANALTATGSNLLWYTAASGGIGNPTAPTPPTTNAGTMSFFVSQSVNNCESNRSQIDVIVNVTPTSPTVTNPVTYCQNESASQLAATGNNLLWYNSATGGIGITTAPTPSTVNAGSTNYYVSQTAGNCESNRSQIIVVVNATPQTPVITQNQIILTSSSATGNQWYDSNGLIIGETNQTYTATVDGNYYVIVTVNGCNSSQSNSINVTIIGITKINLGFTVNIYPNPVKNEITIETNCTAKQKCEILNILGEQIYITTVEKKAIFDVSQLNSGIYFMKIYTEKSSVVKRFVKE